jgi:G3E family GTPase
VSRYIEPSTTCVPDFITRSYDMLRDASNFDKIIVEKTGLSVFP